MSYFGWRKDQSVKKPLADGPGRRLMPAELAEAAAAMGLPVSSSRYEPETREGRNKRAVGYVVRDDNGQELAYIYRACDRRAQIFLAQFDGVNVGLGRSGSLPCAFQLFRFC
jgi:hypothetical protein